MGTEQSKTTESFFKKILRYYLAFVGVSLVIALTVYFWFPDFMPYFIEEDHLVENMSAFFYLLAFFLALWVLKNYKAWRKLTGGVAAIGLIGFLDELSFGERIFAFNPPELLGENIDAVHDFIAVIYIFMVDIFSFYGLLLLVLGSAIGIVILFVKQQKYEIRDFIGDPASPPGLFLVLFFFLLVTASLFDMKVFIEPLVLMEELFELYGGIALCLYSISLAEICQAAENPKPAIESSVVEAR